MDPSPGPSSRRRRKKGKATDDHSPTPGARPSTTVEGAPTLASFFLPAGPPRLKQPRSSTVSTMPGMEENLQRGYSHKAYFMDVYKAASKRLEVEPYVPEMEGQIIIEIIASIYKDYRSAVDTLMESIDLLAQEVVSLQAAQPRPDIPAPIPISLANTKTPGPTAGSGTQPPANLLPAEPKASWATVARKGGKKRNTFQTGTTPVQPKPTTNTKPS